MKKVYLLLAGLAFLCWGCAGDGNKSRVIAELGNGGVVTGGVINVNEIENFRSLLPIAINEMNSYHISTQVYEGLVRYDQVDLSVIPALARSWDISSDNLEYTFHLRTGVKFHNDPCFKDGVGRTVKASDVKYCFENLCSMNINNSQYDVTFRDRVEGANDFFAESKSGKVRTFKGIQVLDDSTISIRLIHPDANFLNVLAMPGCYIYPREADVAYGPDMRVKCVGTGPFYIETIKEGEGIVMKKNKDYWGVDKFGNKLPYLDGIKWSFIGDKKTEVMEFRKGNLDMIYRIPVEMFQEIFGEMQENKQTLNFDVFSSPALSTHYYGFNLQMNPFFAIKEVRQAFNLAIDRHKIADFTIKGEGRPADWGVVPYTEVFERNGYDYKSLKGFKYDPDSAKKLLASVGYESGKGLPDFNLEINNGGGDRNIMVALVVQKMLKQNLGVNMNMNVVPWPEHVENIQSGKTDFFRYAWVSDYADPESFLTQFYGKNVPENYQDKSYINLARFRNKTFDALFLEAKAQPDKKKRYKLFSQAEQIILDEAAFMPLFYDENFRLVQKNVHNLEENPLNYVDMRATFISPPKNIR